VDRRGRDRTLTGKIDYTCQRWEKQQWGLFMGGHREGGSKTKRSGLVDQVLVGFVREEKSGFSHGGQGGDGGWNRCGAFQEKTGQVTVKAGE